MQSKQSEFDYQINEIMSQAQSQIESLQNEIESKSMQVEKLSERASSLERDELALYPKVKSLWIEKAKRTVSIDEIVDVTGLSKQRIRAAVTGGKIVRDNRNKDVFRVASVIEWLKNVPAEKANNSGMISEPTTDPLPVTNGHRKVTQPLALVPLEV
jgi:seryl-tRNA synthetase